MTDLKTFIQRLPKAELHLHIEGTLEPELMFALAERNRIKLKYPSIAALKQAYDFNNLQEFLDLYYEGSQVLLTEKDFYDLAFAYFKQAKHQNIRHAEIFFDPQSHTARGIKLNTVIEAIHQAQEDARNMLGVSSGLVLSFLRHLDEQSAIETFETAKTYRDWIIGVGLDSSERNNPPAKFQAIFEQARNEGFHIMAHAGEEGPAEYIREAINLLKVERIDHGNRAMDDASLLKELAASQIPLTLCPLSNLKLKVIRDLSQHPVKKMLEMGILVTLNSDDPAYFGGYINENYLQTALALDLTPQQLVKIAENSFRASFLSEEEKEKYLSEIRMLKAECG